MDRPFTAATFFATLYSGIASGWPYLEACSVWYVDPKGTRWDFVDGVWYRSQSPVPFGTVRAQGAQGDWIHIMPQNVDWFNSAATAVAMSLCLALHDWSAQTISLAGFFGWLDAEPTLRGHCTCAADLFLMEGGVQWHYAPASKVWHRDNRNIPASYVQCSNNGRTLYYPPDKAESIGRNLEELAALLQRAQLTCVAPAASCNTFDAYLDGKHHFRWDGNDFVYVGSTLMPENVPGEDRDGACWAIPAEYNMEEFNTYFMFYSARLHSVADMIARHGLHWMSEDLVKRGQDAVDKFLNTLTAPMAPSGEVNFNGIMLLDADGGAFILRDGRWDKCSTTYTTGPFFGFDGNKLCLYNEALRDRFIQFPMEAAALVAQFLQPQLVKPARTVADAFKEFVDKIHGRAQSPTMCVALSDGRMYRWFNNKWVTCAFVPTGNLQTVVYEGCTLYYQAGMDYESALEELLSVI